MNLLAVTLSNSIGVVILGLLMINSHPLRQRRQPSDRIFTLMIVLAAAACICETASFWVDGRIFTGAHLIAVAVGTLSYAINITLSFLWCIYVDLRLYKQPSRLKKYYSHLAALSLILILALIPNLKWGYLFTVNDLNIYHRQPLGYIYFGSVFLYLGWSMAVRHSYYKNSQKAKFFNIWVFLAPVIIGSALQLAFYGLSLVWCSVAIALAATYMSLQNELSYIDPLTKLYNRNYLNFILSDISRKGAHVGGIMIDIDFFKGINDTYGHSVGDQALVNTADIIRNAKPAKSIAVRYAGDEFIIISEAESEFELLNIDKSLRNQLKKFNSEEKNVYQLSLSLGMSLFNGERSIDSFLNEMDDRMYSEKKKKHCRTTA